MYIQFKARKAAYLYGSVIAIFLRDNCVCLYVLREQHLCSTADRAETTDRQKNSLDECKEGSEGGRNGAIEK